MTTENAAGRELVIPLTGELVDLNSATDVLAEATKRIRDLEQELTRLRAAIGNVIVERMDHENLRTAEVGEYVITVDAPGGVDWDAKKLEGELWRLVDHDSISGDAMDRVMPMKRAVSVRELKKLLPTLTDDDHERVADCSSPSRRARRVKVDDAETPAKRV